MKKKKFTLAVALIGIAALFSSCNDKKDEPQLPPEGSTYMTLTITTPDNSLRDGSPEIGKWNGKDKIASIDIYISDDATKVVTASSYDLSDFTITPAEGTNNIQIKPKEAILTKPGKKKVYVLLNATEKAKKALAVADAGSFLKAFEQVAQADKLEDVAKIEKDNTSKVMMSNDLSQEHSVDIEDGVDAKTALAGKKNKATVKVQRVAARINVTAPTNEMEIKDQHKNTIAKVKYIIYSVGQVENKYYIAQYLKEGVLQSPAFGFVPAKVSPEAAEHFFYDDLANFSRKVLPKKGDTAPVIGEASLANGAFALENAHADANYKKGNTTYILVRTLIQPQKFTDGTAVDAYKGTYDKFPTAEEIKAAKTKPEDQNYATNGSFWVGNNGGIYASKANALNPDKGGVKGQVVELYFKGKAVYWAYPNPDQVGEKYKEAKKFPIKRNNIYNVNITAFSQIGHNWNPIHPGGDDPSKNPDPDPTPGGGDDPSPDEPINPEETYMAVEVSVIPWAVHSYNITL